MCLSPNPATAVRPLTVVGWDTPWGANPASEDVADKQIACESSRGDAGLE